MFETAPNRTRLICKLIGMSCKSIQRRPFLDNSIRFHFYQVASLLLLVPAMSLLIACAQHADQWYFRPPQASPEDAEWSAVPPYPEEIVRALGLKRPAEADAIGGFAEGAENSHGADDANRGGGAGAGADPDLRDLADWYPRVDVVSYECRELRSLDVRTLIDTFGAPHARAAAQPAGGNETSDDGPHREIWTYTLDPCGNDAFPKRDLRLIGRIRAEFPRLPLQFEVEGGTVRRATVPWCFERPAYDYTIRALLGPPHEVSEPDGNQVVWSYRYECLTTTTVANGATHYRMRHLRLWLQIDNERHTGGVHIEVGAAMSLRVTPGGAVDNLFVGERWPMRLDGVHQLLDIGLKSITTAEEVEFTFGRPGAVRSAKQPGRNAESWEYPLTPDVTTPTADPVLIVTIVNGNASELRVTYPDGIPTDAATLQSMLGVPTSRDGPDLYGHERWSYQYRCHARPPFGFPPEWSVLETPVRIVFDVRSGVRVDLLAELVKGRPRLTANGNTNAAE